MTRMDTILAVDVGGTKMLGGILDREGQCLHQQRCETPAALGGAAVAQALLGLVRQLQRWCMDHAGPPLAVGLSVAGVVDPARACVTDATEAMPGWAGTDLRAALQPATGALPVHAINDVHAALMGEHWQGGLRGVHDSAVMLTLGTGLGGAWMAQGRLQFGARGIAGHWGRTSVREGPEWVTLDQRCSGSGLARLARMRGVAAADGRAALQAASEGDAAAQAALAEWIEDLAMLLRNLRWTLDPQAIVIGGGLITARALWWPSLTQALDGLDLAVRPAELGEHSGLIGAGRWALDSIGRTG